MSEKPIAYVVEDNPDLASIFVEALSAAGYQTKMIHDGTEAFDAVLKDPPDLIMLDLHLPGLKGDEILRRIRDHEALKNIRVLIASADARMAEQLRDERTVVLNKPVGFVQLQHLARRFGPTRA